MESSGAIETLAALAHPGRLAVFRLLIQAGAEGAAAGEIARRLETPANTMSAQLAILARAGLIAARRDGRSIVYAVEFDQVRDLVQFLMEDCCQGRLEVCAPVTTAVACR